MLGTERHEARRIDNQLRGRSGRQGDAGESRFYLSGQDDLVRLFAGDRIFKIMDRFKIPEGEPMEAGILSRQIENAQKKVEEQNFVMRKNVLKYDDVLNKQRRSSTRSAARCSKARICSRRCRRGSARSSNGWSTSTRPRGPEIDLDALVQAMKDLYATEITVDELREEVGVDRAALMDEFVEDALDEYTAKEECFGENPDSSQPLMRELERFVILQVVDTRWREHLENMDYLREGVHLRAMAQKDPLVEYTSEGHAMFEELNAAIREEVVFTLFHAELAPEEAELLAMQDGQGNGAALEYQHESLAGADAIAAAGMAGGELGGSVSTAGATMAPVGGRIGDHRTARGRRQGEDRPQRSVLVRIRKEVQEVPRRLAALAALVLSLVVRRLGSGRGVILQLRRPEADKRDAQLRVGRQPGRTGDGRDDRRVRLGTRRSRLLL